MVMAALRYECARRGAIIAPAIHSAQVSVAAPIFGRFGNVSAGSSTLPFARCMLMRGCTDLCDPYGEGTAMRIGTDISVLAEPGRPDSSVLAEHLALADLAEPLGFDSLFSLEHHFTGYSMSPSPLQLLAYYAAKTTRITLGTCVIVLPWQDPIRVAEQIAYLDLLCRGRCMFGFERGAAHLELHAFPTRRSIPDVRPAIRRAGRNA